MAYSEIRPENWFKWALAALALVGLFVVGSMSRIVSDTDPADPIVSRAAPSGWQTFRSEVLGIQVAYPPEWSVGQDSVIEASVSFANSNNVSEQLRIYLVAPDAEAVIREALTSFAAKPVEIDGQAGSLYQSADADGTISQVALVGFDGKLYYIGGNAPDFEQLLEQVKFLNN